MSAFIATMSIPLAAPRPSVPRSRHVLSKEQVVEQLFEAFSDRRLLDVLPLMTEDILFMPMTAQVTRAGEPYRGHDGMRRYAADVEENWDELILRPTQIKAAGNAVVALGLVSGRGAAASFKDAPTTWMFKFRGEQVCSVQIFSDSSHVSRALGKSE